MAVVQKNKKYIAREPGVEFVSTPDDDIIAHAFTYLADLVERAEKSEDFLLWLSTCRNWRLTTNALFYDAREMIGEDSFKGPLPKAAYLVSKGNLQEAGPLFREIRSLLAIYDQKRSVWNLRDKFFNELEALIKSAPRLSQSILREATSGTSSSDKDNWTSSEYTELSTSFPTEAEALISELDAAIHIVDIISECGFKMPAIAQEDLFQTEDSKWQVISELIHKNHNFWDFTIDYNKDGSICSIQGISKREQNLLLKLIGEKMIQKTEEIYSRLCMSFKANIADSPMPSPFVIDLSISRRSHSSQFGKKIIPEDVSLGVMKKKSLCVAIAKIGIPRALYTSVGVNYEYINDSVRVDILAVILESVKEAINNNADCLVFSEYLIPRNAIAKIQAEIDLSSMIIVGGIEYSNVEGDDAHGDAIVLIPNRVRKIQRKHHASKFEPQLKTNGRQLLFRDSALGAFSVVLCSDYLEVSVMEPIRKMTPLVDVIFICCCNPAYELYEAMAKTDSSRLYCYIVVANNLMDKQDDNSASCKGTLVVAPLKEGARSMDSSRRIVLSKSNSNYVKDSELIFYNLDTEKINKERETPDPTFTWIPRSRRRNDVI